MFEKVVKSRGVKSVESCGLRAEGLIPLVAMGVVVGDLGLMDVNAAVSAFAWGAIVAALR